jgi:hypothetical protein
MIPAGRAARARCLDFAEPALSEAERALLGMPVGTRTYACPGVIPSEAPAEPRNLAWHAMGART